MIALLCRLRGWGPASRAAFAVGLAFVLAACSSSEPLTFEKALAEATDNLVAQTGKLPVFLARLESKLAKPDPKQPKRVVTIDPMLDTITGQQTETTALFERRVVQRIGNLYPQFQLLPFQAANLSRAQYLLTGTMSKVPTAPIGKPTVRLDLALVDLKTGLVVAQASAQALEENLDSTPSRYYRDSPVLIKDKVVEGYARSAATPTTSSGSAPPASSTRRPRSTTPRSTRTRSAPTAPRCRRRRASSCACRAASTSPA